MSQSTRILIGGTQLHACVYHEMKKKVEKKRTLGWRRSMRIFFLMPGNEPKSSSVQLHLKFLISFFTFRVRIPPPSPPRPQSIDSSFKDHPIHESNGYFVNTPRETGGAVANRLRRRTSDQAVLGSNPAVAAALSPWTIKALYSHCPKEKPSH